MKKKIRKTNTIKKEEGLLLEPPKQKESPKQSSGDKAFDEAIDRLLFPKKEK
ncbi:hypothetical protein [Pararcticibacter amylolyticus]|uniref:hypothetical protein n=1 Tax=Pararcticibacter amylolyticus TaxID=2173175 RepID=UPI001304888E|nr:hypothetical protein [Pararcticibacter amylolyticus]